MTDRICKKIEQNKYNKLLKILIACGGFLFACVFISVKAHAESIDSSTIPYNVSQMASYNEMMLTNIDQVKQIVYTNYNIDDTHSLLIWTNDGFFRNAFYEYYIIIDPSAATGYTYTEDYDFTTNKIHFISTYQVCRIVIRLDNAPPEVSMSNGLFAHLMGSSQSVSTSNGSYLPLYPFYYDGEPIESQEGYTLLIANGNGSVVTGSTVAPNFGAGAGVNGSDFLGTGADFGASLSQATMPQTPTYNTFNFNTFNPPTFDDSSILDALDSIAQILIYTGNYIVSNILGAFSTLMSNIVLIGEYIVGVLEYIGRSIITNIQNAVQNLYENFVSLLQPLFDLVSVIKEKIDYITEPFNKDEFFHQVDGNHLITACMHIESYGQQMKSILTNAQERNTFHINISYPKPDGTSFNTMISFDWLYPLRHLYMPYLWVFTILYLFFSACRLLGNVIGGKS